MRPVHRCDRYCDRRLDRWGALATERRAWVRACRAADREGPATVSAGPPCRAGEERSDAPSAVRPRDAPDRPAVDAASAGELRERQVPTVAAASAGGERPDPADAAASAGGERLGEAMDAAWVRRAAHLLAVHRRRRIQQKRPEAAMAAKSAGGAAPAEAVDAARLAFPYPETRGAGGDRRESGRAAAAKQAAPGGREQLAMREPLAPRARAASAHRPRSGEKSGHPTPTGAGAELSPLCLRRLALPPVQSTTQPASPGQVLAPSRACELAAPAQVRLAHSAPPRQEPRRREPPPAAGSPSAAA